MSKILITGCRGGIGLAAALRLAEKGHFVYATVHREESVKDLEKKFEPFSKNSYITKLDITLPEDRNKILGWDIDVLVNNAAIGDSGPLIEIDVRKIRDVMETNLFSAIALTQLAVKKMISRGSGRVVIIGSVYGLVPTPFIAPYGMTKFALEDLAYSLRGELKPFGIPVVMVNPGAYDTGFNKKNIDKKYKWIPKDSLYKDKMGYIKKSEDQLYMFELKNIDGIVKQVVKAITDKKPKKRYKAPWWLWPLLPTGRKLG